MEKIKCFECAEFSEVIGNYVEIIDDYLAKMPDGEILVVPNVVTLVCDKCDSVCIPPESSWKIEEFRKNWHIGIFKEELFE